jgi:hypothetical protein
MTAGAGSDRVGVITLLTDFGLRDPFVGVMKGVLLARCSAARIVDLTHGVAPQDVAAAAYWIARVFRYFPAGTVHVVVVDPTVGTDRALLGCRAHAQYFLAPDNGVLTDVLATASDLEVRTLHSVTPGAGVTFAGRDVFAPAAARLCNGEPLADLGAPLQDWVRLQSPVSRREGDWNNGQVVIADHFGNLITNIELQPGETPRAVECQGLSVAWGRTYADGKPGEALALLNSWGALEIAVPRGNASELLGAGVGSAVRIQMAPGGGLPSVSVGIGQEN